MMSLRRRNVVSFLERDDLGHGGEKIYSTIRGIGKTPL